MPSKPAFPSRSTAVEDYLEQILDLINTKGYARVADIAQGLKISQASVTNMVQRLDAEGLLKYEKYRGLVLTTAGETLARNIMLRHHLLTDFLRTLGIREEAIYHDVEGMEHHISPQTLQAIEALLAELRKNPALVERVRSRASGSRGRSAESE
jgi:Mn-dependent DtxR family transcriptional regulator